MLAWLKIEGGDGGMAQRLKLLLKWRADFQLLLAAGMPSG